MVHDAVATAERFQLLPLTQAAVIAPNSIEVSVTFPQTRLYLELEGLHSPDKAVASLDVLQEAQDLGCGSLALLFLIAPVQGGERQQLAAALQGLSGFPGCGAPPPPYSDLDCSCLLSGLPLYQAEADFQAQCSA